VNSEQQAAIVLQQHCVAVEELERVIAVLAYPAEKPPGLRVTPPRMQNDDWEPQTLLRHTTMLPPAKSQNHKQRKHRLPLPSQLLVQLFQEPPDALLRLV
jgi:hypothetical protein